MPRNRDKKSYGTCKYFKSSPVLTEDHRDINVGFTYEEALKLHMAIQQCVGRLSRQDLRTSPEDQIKLNVRIIPPRRGDQVGRVTITEDPQPVSEEADGEDEQQE